MERIDWQVARKAKEMTRQEVFVRAAEGKITWLQAADILRLSPRQVRRLRHGWKMLGTRGVRDGRGGRKMRKYVSAKTVRAPCRLKREEYAGYSVRHFYQLATEKHGLPRS